MTTQIHNILLSKIKPIEDLHVSNAFIARMKKNYKDQDEYDLLLAVEKDHHNDFYHLVGGLDRHYFLVNHTNRKEAPLEGGVSSSVAFSLEVPPGKVDTYDSKLSSIFISYITP